MGSIIPETILVLYFLLWLKMYLSMLYLPSAMRTFENFIASDLLRGVFQFGLEDITVFHIYHVPSQFEAWLI